MTDFTTIRTTTYLMALALLVGWTPTSLGQALRTIALSGDPIAEVPGARFHTIFFNPIINNAGHATFFNLFTRADAPGESFHGVWSDVNGVLKLVAKSGDLAPGAPCVLFDRLEPYAIDTGGHVAFFSSLKGPGISTENFYGVWREENEGPSSLMLRGGGPVPGITDTQLIYLASNPFFNETGHMAIAFAFAGPGVTDVNNTGIWSEGRGGHAQIIAREGDLAPGADGALYGDLSSGLTINNAGRTAFRGYLSGPGVTSSNNIALWREEADGGISLVARKGDPAPEANGALFGDYHRPALNDAGHTAFDATLSGAGVTPWNNAGIWSDTGGELTLIARKGEPAPGANGAIFNSLISPTMNDSGHIAFIASAAPPTMARELNYGIWSEGQGRGLELVAMSGYPAPGVAGAVFEHVNEPVLNDLGQVALLGRLEGPGVSFTNDYGIWAQDLSGKLTLIAREGDLLDVNDDPLINDYRKISLLGFAGDLEAGRGTGFNNLGQVAFKASFTDGSDGVFVSYVVAVPEPNPLVGVASLTVGLFVRRRNYAGVGAGPFSAWERWLLRSGLRCERRDDGNSDQRTHAEGFRIG